MDNSDIFGYLNDLVVFRRSDIRKISASPDYFINKYLNKKIFRLDKGKYSITKEKYVIANYYHIPSYITAHSALSIHNCITQLPNDVVCFTTKKPKHLKDYKIEYHKTKNFFGFEKKDFDNFKINIALPEKAILDSFGIDPLEIFLEAFRCINLKLIKELVVKTKNRSLIKRIGYILEFYGYDSEDLLKCIDSTYVLLDPLSLKKGKKDKKWKIINNYGDLNV